MPRPPGSVLLSYLSAYLFLRTSRPFEITSIAMPYYRTLDAKQGLDRAALGLEVLHRVKVKHTVCNKALICEDTIICVAQVLVPRLFAWLDDSLDSDSRA